MANRALTVEFVMSPANSLVSSTDNSYGYQLQNTSTLLTSGRISGANQSVQVSAHAYQHESTTVTIGVSNAPATYAVPELEKTPPSPAPELQAQNNILDFIALRLQRDVSDGATQEDIALRLQQALEGFVTGYRQAYDELASAGLLSADVEGVISQTYDDVLSGIEELAEYYGVESPVETTELQEELVGDEPELGRLSSIANFDESGAVESTLAALNQLAKNRLTESDALSTLLASSQIGFEHTEKRDFSFSLTTQDGDTVTITASAYRSAQAESNAIGYADGYAASVDATYAESNAFRLSVEGELDEGELEAINDLLQQVGELSDRFYGGNIEDAFEMALNIGFDESEIARFSLDLKLEITTKVENTYTQFAPVDDGPRMRPELLEQMNFANGDNSIRRLFEFVKMLNDAMETSNALGMDINDLPSLAQDVANIRNAQAQQDERLAPFVQNIQGLLTDS